MSEEKNQDTKIKNRHEIRHEKYEKIKEVLTNNIRKKYDKKIGKWAPTTHYFINMDEIKQLNIGNIREDNYLENMVRKNIFQLGEYKNKNKKIETFIKVFGD